MTRQTVSQLPVDVSDPVAVRRFLERLTQGVDTSLGLRGTNQLAETQASQQAELQELSSQVAAKQEEAKTAEDSLAAQVEDLEYTLEETEKQVRSTQVGAEAYKDFNAQSWLEIVGCIEFSALGKDMTNPPMSLGADTTYVFSVRNVKLATGCLTELSVISDRLDAVYRRFNLTQWKQLA